MAKLKEEKEEVKGKKEKPEEKKQEKPEVKKEETKEPEVKEKPEVKKEPEKKEIEKEDNQENSLVVAEETEEEPVIPVKPEAEQRLENIVEEAKTEKKPKEERGKYQEFRASYDSGRKQEEALEDRYQPMSSSIKINDEVLEEERKKSEFGRISSPLNEESHMRQEYRPKEEQIKTYEIKTKKKNF